MTGCGFKVGVTGGECRLILTGFRCWAVLDRTWLQVIFDFNRNLLYVSHYFTAFRILLYESLVS